VWSRPVERLLARALPRGAPSRTRMLLSVAVEVVAAGGQAPEMAAALGVGERTVTRWFERADLPPPRRLFAWLRLLLAADLLDDPERSLESISRATGYAGAPSLKSALRNLLATTPRELRERGAFSTVAARFSSELFDLREQSRSAGKPARVWLH
jgi:transcriptional regulator GlxA family with amidase domain